MSIEIETGVPIPDSAHGNARYPWKQMEVGNSFFIAATEADLPKAARKLKSSANSQSKNGRKFVSKTVNDQRECGVRVWRIK